uniref:Ovule protein n=1 Tax=Ascaris lumbricoides TaxID=6252 RepID=A0A0M3I025_ASCLU
METEYTSEILANCRWKTIAKNSTSATTGRTETRISIRKKNGSRLLNKVQLLDYYLQSLTSTKQ